MEIIFKQHAKEQGLPRYFTGKPCKRGHVDERYITKGDCVSCAIQRASLHNKNNPEKRKITRDKYRKNNVEKCRAAEKKYRLNNIEKEKQRNESYRLNNVEKEKNRCAKYRKNNRNQIKQRQVEHYENNREKINQRHTEYRKNNSEIIKLTGVKWRKNNPEKNATKTAHRRTKKLQRTPLWLSHKDRKEILEFYKESKRLTDETGVKHHVDHIIPLQGKIVCGLHVPWNLQVLTAVDNMSKGNRLAA